MRAMSRDGDDEPDEPDAVGVVSAWVVADMRGSFATALRVDLNGVQVRLAANRPSMLSSHREGAWATTAATCSRTPSRCSTRTVSRR
ncbi:hypothetical protein NOCA110103 [metagenome]|uniref:Uncharacterized protein n=1 Tax=metagenome TaxID=256318 RepID=A0A2P2C211_9ZZZZ